MRLAPYIAIAAAVATPSASHAHNGGLPAIAKVIAPETPGVIADESFVIRWEDADEETQAGPATVELFYTASWPRTLRAGEMPDVRTSTVIVTGILEPDLANAHLWDTSAIPSGHYWIWSTVREPASESTPPITGVSPAPLTIRHGNDDVGPSIALLTPGSPFRVADQSYLLRYLAFDPDGGATVRLEAARSLEPAARHVIADGLSAAPSSSFVWDTSALATGEWMVFATISGAGRTFTAYAPYFLYVVHASAPDAGGADLGPDDTLGDAGMLDTGGASDGAADATDEDGTSTLGDGELDGGMGSGPSDGGGRPEDTGAQPELGANCRCSASDVLSRRTSAATWLLAAALLLSRRRMGLRCRAFVEELYSETIRRCRFGL